MMVGNLTVFSPEAAAAAAAVIPGPRLADAMYVC
jgi:hypothetical protein